VIDIYSVSLNAPDEKTYNSICHPIDPEHAFSATLAFVREGVRRGVRIAVTALDIPEVDIKATRALAAELGVELYVHSREPVFEEEVVR
jgi:TatD DNase family protein